MSDRAEQERIVLYPDDEGWEPRRPHHNPPNIYEMAALRKLGAKAAPGWRAYGFDARKGKEDGRIRITGSVPVGTYNDGSPVWKGRGQTVTVTQVEIEETRIAYERETGKCAECGGDGFRLCGWSAKRGVKYRDCEKCNATGTPSRLAPTAALPRGGGAGTDDSKLPNQR